MKIIRTVAFLSIASLCGCQTVKQARQAQSTTDRLPGETTVTAAEAGLGKGAPYALTNLEQIARSYHPAILQAKQAVESARLQCRMVHSARLPQITASGTYSRNTQNAYGRHPSSTEMSGSWSGSLGLDLLLYDFGKLNAQEKQALSALIAAEQQLREAEQGVVYNVRSAFFEQHRVDHLYRVALESEKQYAQHLEEVRTMALVGTRRQYDVTKAEVDWGNARLLVITASNAFVVAHALLSRTLGLADNPPFAITESLFPTYLGSVGELMSLARGNAPALAVLRARERAASAYVDQTIAELYPDLSLSPGASFSGRGFPFAWNFSWALHLAQNIFDGHRKTDRINDAVTQLRTARAQVADAEQSLYLELVNAFTLSIGARKRSEISLLVERQTQENLSIVNEQYRVGVSSSIERTDAQVTLTQAQADVIRAHYDEQAAYARIAQLIGDPVVAGAPAKNN
ncbi:MAG: TolC family protein [bacterium]